MNNPNSVSEQGKIIQEDKPKKKKIWLWWLGGCGLLACIAIGIIAFYLFNSSGEPSYPLDGNVTFPSTVKKGEDFDFVITLTNSTDEVVFIYHVVLHDLVTMPNSSSLLVGAKVISVEPNMDAEPLGIQNDIQFAYFQEIKPGETQTVIFHMRAENTGTYYTSVGVYAEDPSKSDSDFIDAFHYGAAKIEITP